MTCTKLFDPPFCACMKNHGPPHVCTNPPPPLLFLTGPLQCNQENREHLQYLRNVYCVMTNHGKDQDMWTSHKTLN